MGVVYHARYLVWLDVARTEHIREAGVPYKELEAQGISLAVTEVQIRYRRAAHYDDWIRVRCWVRAAGSRGVTFGYAVEREESDDLLATARVSLMALGRDHQVTRLPEHVSARLVPTPDPVRL